jgi:two-component system LytT family sensor kinase
MAMTSRAKRGLIWAGLALGLFTLLALLSAGGAYVSQMGMDHPVPWVPLLRQELKDWYVCGVLSVAAFWFCGLNQLQPGRTRRWIGVHVVAGLVFSCVDAVLTSWLVAGEKSIMHPGTVLTFSYLIRMVGIHYCVLNLILYWLVVFAHLAWNYYQRYCEREVQTAELKRELTEARLSALRMQLNPHFLFNTLHAVSALIHDNPEAADRVVARLSELLRLSLDQTKPQEVPLSEEMAFLDRYLEIEQTRFAERLKVDKEIDANVEQALVPYLILQPLVENAIRHGIEPREDMGHLGIRARRNNGTLELRISDNGAGLSADSLPTSGEGIGLSNTRSRLRHLYGEDFRFELADAQGGGLEARIDIPFRLQREVN